MPMNPSFDPSTKVGDIVAAHPSLARVFERVGIDYCCGGKRTLAQACTPKGLDPKTVVVMLEAATQVTPASGGAIDVLNLRLAALADHIETTHHAYLKEELPALLEKAERVAMKHGWRDSRLPEVALTVRELAIEMFEHMEKEEQVLFPLVRELETNRQSPKGTIAEPIRQMESEHDRAGHALERLRELTDGFAVTEECCNTHRALLSGLAQLEADMHTHVHKENNVLFPRAITLETELARS